MPLELQGLSTAGTFHLIGWFLLALAVVELGCVLAASLFGDRRTSPLNRCGTWMARQLKDDDGKPLVQPGETPSSARQLLSSLYFLGFAGVMLWLAVSFIQVD